MSSTHRIIRKKENFIIGNDDNKLIFDQRDGDVDRANGSLLIHSNKEICIDIDRHQAFELIKFLVNEFNFECKLSLLTEDENHERFGEYYRHIRNVFERNNLG